MSVDVVCMSVSIIEGKYGQKIRDESIGSWRCIGLFSLNKQPKGSIMQTKLEF